MEQELSQPSSVSPLRLTQKQMSGHYQITAPAMRKLLVEAGLSDGLRPTRAGHLIAGATYFEHDAGTRSTRWPIWPLDRIEALFPQLLSSRDSPATTFENRYVAMVAMKNAGQSIATLLAAGRLPPSVAWLTDDPDVRGLSQITTRHGRAAWTNRHLKPLLDILSTKRGSFPARSLTTFDHAVAILAGVDHWLSGASQAALDKPIKYESPPLAIEHVSFDERGIRLRISPETLVVLKAGYAISDLRHGNQDEIARNMILGLLQDDCPEAFREVARADLAAFTLADAGWHLVITRQEPGFEAWQLTSFPITIRDDEVLIGREWASYCRLYRLEDSLLMSGGRGSLQLSCRAAAIIPHYGGTG